MTIRTLDSLRRRSYRRSRAVMVQGLWGAWETLWVSEKTARKLAKWEKEIPCKTMKSTPPSRRAAP